MDNTSSISKGVFIFKNGAKAAGKRTNKQPKKIEEKAFDNIYAGQLWYNLYSTIWSKLEADIQTLNKGMFSSVLSNLVLHIKNSYETKVTEIPSAALLTGINMPDHAAQFSSLSKQIKEEVTPHVACLYAQDCQNLKYLVENMIMQFVNGEAESSDDEDTENRTSNIKKSQCNFSLLQAWYEKQYSFVIKSPKKTCNDRNSLVVIIPDFESFNNIVLQEFILIASTYLNLLPFILVFGVATSLTVLHKSLPYQVSSKVNIQVFNSQPSTMYLNNVLEHVFFSNNCLFHLGGRVFTLFMDIFLFYDLSVTGFIQNFKYAMLEHFSQGNATSLCCSPKYIKATLKQFSHEDFEQVRHLLSFRKLVERESFDNRIKLIEDDTYFKSVLQTEILKIHRYLDNLHLFLKCLHVLVADLPKAPLGKQIRELYAVASSKNITKTQEYKECLQLLGFQSKDELTSKCLRICHVLMKQIENRGQKEQEMEEDHLFECISMIQSCLDKMNNIGLDDSDEEMEEVVDTSIEGTMDRKQLKEKLLNMSKKNKPMNRYEKIRACLLEQLEEVFQKYLVEPTSLHFHEIFFFNDVSIQSNIVGSHRTAIHTALNDPHYYLQCPCCEIPNDSAILRNMPDICIAYKLHLEYGKMINLYDWLQAFLSIVDPVMFDEDEPKEVDPALQARFTQAVAELEFLGFIKSSKRKTDHVARLTWGG